MKILPFGLIPMVFSLVYALLEKGILGDSNFYPSTGNPYNFDPIFPALISLFVGLLIGLFEVLFLSRVFVKDSFAKKIIFKTLIYFGVVLLSIFIISTLTTAHELRLSPFDLEVFERISNFFSSFALWSILLYFVIGLTFCLFYSEISDNLGQYVILNFFTGKYHRPIEEERIFMFVDMKSSTAIAEKLGHVKYFDLLNDFYTDLSEPIMKYSGEIYQYVGDEIVLTWKVDMENLNTNSIDCFFAMKGALSRKASKYLSRYNMVPSFKAAIHAGIVTTGEIGKIKKDFVFTGDVLNTTARIQGLCNSYEAEFLLSETLVELLKVNEHYNLIELGHSELRGKDERITLYTIN